MRAKSRSLFRFRPRVLTLIVFFAAAAVIALANLSCDEAATANGIPYRSYGWPLIWHRIVLSGHLMAGNLRVVGWYCSLPRLAANVAVWLVLLAALTAACEWLLRRYRPRPRWSLRTMLAFVAVVAAVCGWYAHAQNRAALQDPLVPERGVYGVPLVFVDRWGPKWLDILGMDRLRRRIVVASGWYLDSHEPANEQRFLQLARAPDLRHLVEFHVDELSATTARALGGMRQLETLKIRLNRLTPDLPAALSELTQLRKLSISWGRFETASEPADDNDARLVDECLAAIGNMPRLDVLHLGGLPLRGRGLACLAGAKELKSLDVDFWNGDWKGSRLETPVAEDALRAIATLTQLEWLRLNHLKVRNEGLACLGGLTKLKTLSLSSLKTHDRPAFSHLPSLPRLETLEIHLWHIQEDDLRRLAAMPRLKSLSLGISYGIPMAALASLDSLEEVHILTGNEWPEQIEALRAVKHLKRLHLSNFGMPGRAAVLTLDDEKELYVTENDLDGFQHALKALRQSKPGLVIDTESMPVFRDVFSLSRFGVDAYPERPATWLPGGDLTWMTPQELADFEQSGGHASFYGSTYPGEHGQEPVTAEF